VTIGSAAHRATQAIDPTSFGFLAVLDRWWQVVGSELTGFAWFRRLLEVEQMYPRNATVREPIAIGPVVQISDGAVQTSGVTVRIIPIGVAEADGAGTTAYSTNGIVYYTPTQAETNYTSFILIASKSGCIPASVTIVTSASVTAGQVRLEGVTHTGAVIPTVTNLTDLPSVPNNWLTAAGIASGAFTSAKFASGAFDAVWTVSARSLTTFGTLVSDIWSHATRILTAGTNIALAKGTGIMGFNDLDAAGVRSAMGLGSANLDTQLGDIPTVSEFNARTLASADYATAANLATVAGYLDTEIAAILEDTGTTIPAQISALNNISTAQVLAQCTAALETAITELSGVPSATPTTKQALMLLYMALRNRTTTTASAQTIQNDAGSTIATATLSDDGTTMTKGEFA